MKKRKKGFCCEAKGFSLKNLGKSYWKFFESIWKVCLGAWVSRNIEFVRQIFPNFINFNLETCKYVSCRVYLGAFTLSFCLN